MKPELVVPAGDFEALRAAIWNGADAVYLGGKKFNARIQARNFGLDELEQAIRYAHNRNVKIYVTVNTLIADRELNDLDDYLTNLHHLETDAIIVQDVGVLKLCKELHSDLRLHVSTQASVCGISGVKFWVDQGAKRATLPRELSFEEIQKIKGKNGVEVEVFMHGALCFSYSGQCYLSSFLGERSANRGRCASPCRLPYNIITGNGTTLRTDGPHLLSMKDLNLSEDIGKLVSAGVDALKIEGRMKIPEYVAVVTGIYRKLIDDDYRQPTHAEQKELEAIFNREFTKGSLYRYPGGKAINSGRPGNRGIEVGTIVGYDESFKKVSILFSEAIRVGDGLEFMTSFGYKGLVLTKLFTGGRRTSEILPKCVGELFLPFQPIPNSFVRKTRDSSLHEKARATFSNQESIPQIHNSKINFNQSRGYERLSSLVLTTKNEQTKNSSKICVEVNTLDSIRHAIKAGADEIYFGGFPESTKNLDLNNYRQAIDIANESGVPITIVLSKMMGNDEHLKEIITTLKSEGADKFLVGDIDTLELVKQMGLTAYLDSSLNVFNRVARNLLFKSTERMTLSHELHLSQVARIAGGAPGEIEYIVHGPLVLMLSEYCPVSNAINSEDKISCRKTCNEKGFYLKDKKDLLYPVKCDEFSRTNILSSKDICLIEHLQELKAVGVDIFRIRCQLFKPNMIPELVKLYRTGLSIDNIDQGEDESLVSLKGKILKLSDRKTFEGKINTGIE